MLKNLYLLALTLIFSFNLYAQSTPESALRQLLQNIHTMRADFTQTMTDKNARQIQRATGKIAMERPGKFRWDVKKPAEQLIVTNGQKVWIYDPDLEQVTIRFLTKEVGESPAMLLSNPNVALDKDFSVKLSSESGSALQWFLLTPKSQNSMFASIRIGFQKNDIREMILEDHLGHLTAIEFYNIQLNNKLNPTQFIFNPPPNIDIIDETRR